MPILLELVNQIMQTSEPKIIDNGITYHCYVRYFYIYMVNSLNIGEVKVDKSYIWNDKYRVCFLEQDWVNSDIMTNDEQKHRFKHLK